MVKMIRATWGEFIIKLWRAGVRMTWVVGVSLVSSMLRAMSLGLLSKGKRGPDKPFVPVIMVVGMVGMGKGTLSG